jgi:hypothetical protein
MLLGITIAATLGGASGAQASQALSAPVALQSGHTAAAINEAVAAQGTSPVASNSDVSIPSTGSGIVTLDGAGAGDVEIDLPARGVADEVAKTTVFDATDPGAQIAVQPTADGVRALVVINSAQAPQRYPFPLRGDVVRLDQQPDGSVNGYDADGRVFMQIAPAWARDAAGRSVPTHYEIAGTTLTQVVEHRGGNYAYGITADPLVKHWWGIGWRFSNSQSKTIFQAVVAGAAGAVGAAICGYLSRGNVYLAGFCGAFVGKIFSDIGKAGAEAALRNNRCLEVGVRYTGGVYAQIVNC